MESLAKIMGGLLKLLTHFFAYNYGKTKKENEQLRKNEKKRNEYEDIDDMDIAANDVYAEWLRNDK